MALFRKLTSSLVSPILRRSLQTSARSFAEGQMPLTFASPTHVHYNGVSVKQIDVPSYSGSFGILPNHVPSLAVIKPGLVTVYEEGGDTKKFFVSSGTISVNDDSSVQVIAEEAYPIDQLDAQRKSKMASSGVNRNVSKRHKWSISLTPKNRTDRQYDLPSPPGYNAALGQVYGEISRESDANLIVKKSWDIALGPLKQLPMNLFIMYMAGNSISIFPIMMVGMLFLRPVKALLTVSSTFKMIEGGQAILQKLVYLFGNVVCLALALYKCSAMGLLPTHSSDWLDFIEPQQRMEYAGGGLTLN